MKILHILDHSIPLHSGYTFRTRAILEQQRKRGWQTSHVTSCRHTTAEYPKEEVEGFTFFRSQSPNAIILRLPFINQYGTVQTLSKRLKEIIPELKPDILHAHSPALNGLAALNAAKSFAIPVVYECRAFWEDAAVDHGTTTEGSLRYQLTRALETYVFKHAAAVTTICRGLRSEIILRGISENKITVISNAVDIEKFSVNGKPDQNLRNRLGLQDKMVLGFIGSFYAYEGLPLLIKALPKILQAMPETRLLLVGGGPQEKQIKQQVREYGLEKHVIFTGRVPHQQIQEYYYQVDIFIYPRLSMRLTDLVTPLKPLEAMAQGKLVVASDVGGHRELIEDNKNGALFKAGDASALSAAVLKLWGNREQWQVLRHNGRKFVEEERNWERSVGNYQQVYDAVLSRSNKSKNLS